MPPDVFIAPCAARNLGDTQNPPRATDGKNRILLGLCFAVWLIALGILAVAPAGRRQQGLNHTLAALALLDRAQPLFEAHRLAFGSYPDTRRQWRAVNLESLIRLSPEPPSPKDIAAALTPWVPGPEPAFIYQSDGTDFKLIVHNPADCARAYALSPERIDPIRTAYSRQAVSGGYQAATPNHVQVALARDPMLRQDPALPNPLHATCWALGIWSAGAINW